jgi:8-oxo-dGTP diphosphatase
MSDYDPNYVDVPVYFRLGVKTVIINPEHKILLLKRSAKTSNPHSWDFGGGGVDKGENPADAASREAQEETGLDVDELQPLTTYLDASGSEEAVIIAFTAYTNSQEVRLSWEHESFQWVTWDELKSLQLPGLHAHIRDALGLQRARLL